MDNQLPTYIDYNRDNLFDSLGMTRLKESYMKDGEVSPQERFWLVSKTFSTNEDHARRLYDYSSKHWLSYSTPILSFGRGKRGLPISCFLSYLEDSSEGLVDTLSEVNWLSMLGGGIGIHLRIRGQDEKSAGIMPHLRVYDAASLAYKQGNTRRGSYAGFLDISHPDIIQFMEMRKPTGDQNLKAMNLHHGVNVSDKFMEIIKQCMLDPDHDDSWELISPNNGQVVEIVSAKELWQRLLDLRMQTGEPYIVFADTANKSLPSWLKDQGLKINGSNLCTEIFLPTSKERTAVCCLSSLNLEYYDEWSTDPLFIQDVVEMLDNVLQYFIDNAPPTIQKAIYSALRERSIGIGALGLHAYLQKKGIPFEGVMAKINNRQIFKHIHDKSLQADAYLCSLRGPCPDAQEAGVQRRFSHLTAIAPNASSSLIMGNTSPSIEPYRANLYRQDTLSGAHIHKNKFLMKALEELGMNTDDVWASIASHDGSVQHLDLPELTKAVFKTAMEIDQQWVIELAADRQEFLDQGQSVNLFFPADVSVKYLHAIHYSAWAKSLKSLYYCRSDKIRKADKLGNSIERKKLDEEVDLKALTDGTECLACEG